MWPKKKLNGHCLPCHDPTSIGNLLVSHGFLTTQQVEEAAKLLSEQWAMKLGEYLVSKSLITEAQLEFVLLKQGRLRGKRLSVAQVDDAMRIAEKGTERLGSQAEQLNALTSRALGKIRGG